MVSGQIYIVGPCAAESREQVLETARQIIGVLRDRLRLTEQRPASPDRTKTELPDRLIFRAGVWKPRTNPNTFQGIGNKALEWLAEVKQRYGLPIATEVATAEHVEAAMQAGIDYLWIGARTSANPIAVSAIAEKIADRLRLTEDRPLTLTEQRPAAPDRTKTELPLKGILIKNPVNKDAALWLGNIERLEKTGVNVYAVHRGCGHEPCWSMAHQVRLARPDIPMLLDPSHMSGDAAQVPVLMEKIAELGLDGAMIEVHNHPAEALSDAKQQITPEELSAALTEDRPAAPDRTKTANADRLELNWLRAEIDELDEHLWDTIAARMEVSQRIGAWKKAHGVAPLQPERYQTIVERINELTNERGLPTDFALRLYDLIHEESLRQQI